MDSIENIGWGVFFITYFLISAKLVRSNRRVVILLFYTGIIACGALIIRPYHHTEKVNEADRLISPFISILLYAILRFFFKRTKGIEPTFTGFYSLDWFDKEEGRNMTFFDVVVFMGPFLAGVLFPAIIGSCF